MQPSPPHGFGLAWGVPFLGLLLSVALMPMIAPRLWHRRMGAICASWALALLLPQLALHGWAETAAELWHAALAEYLPFVLLLLALFAAGGGILIQGGPGGTPAGNTLMLAIGTLLAGVMGTTGAAMVLIHPLLRANAHRARKLHLVVFFILLVANAGGALSPLGDPPLYIGFLQGVPFLWPLQALAAPLAVLAGMLLAAFFLADRHLAKSEPAPPPAAPLHIRGWANVALVGVVVATVLGQGVWRPGEIDLLGQHVGIERLAGMAVLLAVAVVSVRVTPRAIRHGNLFDWHPMEEVAKLFAAIFITIAPVLAMLGEGAHGPLAPVLRMAQGTDGAPDPLANFWLAGVLSAVLDNAPTYLVFFRMAGIDPAALTGHAAHTLQAISAGSVFFGAVTYIGNAPNMMLRAIASRRGVRVPGFFGYCLWSVPLLLPPFVLLSLVFFTGG